MVAPDSQVAALAEKFEGMLLPGPRKRVTDDVRKWGEQHDASQVDPLMLESYNDAVGESHRQARQHVVR